MSEEAEKIVPDTQHSDPMPPKRRIVRRRRGARRQAEPKQKAERKVAAPKEQTFEDQLEGMSARQTCPNACYMTPGKCIFTGEDACGSPLNGALQSKFMSNPEVLGKRLRAEAWLAHKKVDRRSGK